MKIRTALLAAVAASATLLSACVVVPAHGPAYVPAPVVVAPVAPPAPLVEVVPPVPFYGAVWLGGYWNWVGGRHIWVAGHYEQPRPGYRWEPHRWEPHPQGGWGMRGGEWRPVR